MSSFVDGLLKILFFVMIGLIFKYKKNKSSAILKMLPVSLNKNFKLGFFSYVIFVLCLGISLFDLKGARVKKEKKDVNQKITFIMDYSSSMRVDDVGTSRYRLGINFMQDLVREIPGSDIRVVIYADKAYKVVPFTSDESYVQTKIAALKLGLYPDGGSDLHLGLKESFIEEANGSTVVVLSDFENLDVAKINTVIKEKKLQFFAIGVGTKAGGNIPRGDNKLLSGYVTKGGKKIISRLNEKLLNKIKYKESFLLNINSYPLKSLRKSLLDSYKTNNVGQSTDYLRKRYMPYFVLIGCFFLLFSIFFRNIKDPVGFVVIIFLFYDQTAIGGSPQSVVELSEYANEKFFSEEEEDQKISKIIYKELTKKNLNAKNLLISKFNLSTSLLKINERKNALDIILKNKLITEDKESYELRSNIVNLLRQSARKGKGKDSESQSESGSKNESQEKLTKSEKTKKNNFKKNISEKDRRLLEKLVGDDQVSQAEYMKKKIKKSSRQGSVRW
jgi:hypothetical protein